jgi:hypothetical protein
MRATRSELGNSPLRSVGPPAKPITDARPSIGDGRGNRRSRGRTATASVDAAMVSATSRLMYRIKFLRGRITLCRRYLVEDVDSGLARGYLWIKWKDEIELYGLVEEHDEAPALQPKG